MHPSPDSQYSCKEQRLQIHRQKVDEKQDVEGKRLGNGIRKYYSALIRSCVISLSYIRIKAKLVF